MNAVEDCVASESDTASRERSTARFAPTANLPARPTEGRTGRSFEGRLLSRLITFLGDPALEFVLWTGESVRPASAAEPVARICIERPGSPLWPADRPASPFGESYSDRPDQGRGRPGQCARSRLSRHHPNSKRRFSVVRRGVEMIRRSRRRVNTLHGSQRQHPSPLRHRQQVLFAVAGQDDGVHVRLLPHTNRVARRSASCEDGPRLPQDALEAG